MLPYKPAAGLCQKQQYCAREGQRSPIFAGQEHLMKHSTKRGSTMIETIVKGAAVDQSDEQRLGEGWIRAIAEGGLEGLEAFCHPRVNSRLLTPGQFTNLDTAVDLVAKYKDWYDGCTDFQVEASRVARVGKRLGIGYRFLLRDHGDRYRIEQQIYCTLKDGRVQQLHLLCSGFQLVAPEELPA